MEGIAVDFNMRGLKARLYHIAVGSRKGFNDLHQYAVEIINRRMGRHLRGEPTQDALHLRRYGANLIKRDDRLMVRVEKTIDLTDGRRSEAGMGEWMGHPEPYVAMIKGTVARREARIMEHSAQQSDVCHDRSQPQGIAHRQIDLPIPSGRE